MAVEIKESETPHPLDACYCGDYRYQHENGVGKCKLGSLCTPHPCQKFRFHCAAREENIENHPTHGRKARKD